MADAGNATPTFCVSEPAISKMTTLTVELLWTAPTETAKHHILAIDDNNGGDLQTGLSPVWR